MPETVKCELCSKSFSSVSEREDHQVESHVDSKAKRESKKATAVKGEKGSPRPRNRVIYGG